MNFNAWGAPQGDNSGIPGMPAIPGVMPGMFPGMPGMPGMPGADATAKWDQSGQNNGWGQANGWDQGAQNNGWDQSAWNHTAPQMNGMAPPAGMPPMPAGMPPMPAMPQFAGFQVPGEMPPPAGPVKTEAERLAEINAQFSRSGKFIGDGPAASPRESLGGMSGAMSESSLGGVSARSRRRSFSRDRDHRRRSRSRGKGGRKGYSRSRSRGRKGRGKGKRDRGPDIPDNLHESTLEATPEAVAFRQEQQIRVYTEQPNDPVPAPIFSFQASGLMPQVLQKITEVGFTMPSPIQAQAWPVIAGGRDLIGVAKTGSGKTLAFSLPVFNHILQNAGRRVEPSMLVLAPTRELATQIETEINRFGKGAGIYSVAMYGGAPKHEQLRLYRQGCHIIIACPGRLNDLCESGQVHLDTVKYLVLDEADRMLDMGFEPQIRKIVDLISPTRQTLLFTATWPREVRALARDFQKNPMHVKIGDTDELKGNEDITQQVMFPNGPREKSQCLMQLLRNNPRDDRVIVFSATKRMCENLTHEVNRGGFNAVSIHGDKDQRARDMALEDFRGGKTTVLIATDVAARGLDIKGVKLVVNYDTPNNDEDYVHRIGRTGRAGEKGVAVTFLSRDDAGKKATFVMEVMERSKQSYPEQLKELASMPSTGKGGKGNRFRNPDEPMGRDSWPKGKGKGKGRSRSRSRRGRSTPRRRRSFSRGRRDRRSRDRSPPRRRNSRRSRSRDRRRRSDSRRRRNRSSPSIRRESPGKIDDVSPDDQTKAEMMNEI